MPETDHDDLLRVVRPMLKGHIRQTRNLLAILTQLDTDIESLVAARALRELDQRTAEEAQRHGTTTNGNPRATVRV